MDERDQRMLVPFIFKMSEAKAIGTLDSLKMLSRGEK